MKSQRWRCQHRCGIVRRLRRLGALSLARLNLERLVLGIATALSDDIIERFFWKYPNSLK